MVHFQASKSKRWGDLSATGPAPRDRALVDTGIARKQPEQPAYSRYNTALAARPLGPQGGRFSMFGSGPWG